MLVFIKVLVSLQIHKGNDAKAPGFYPVRISSEGILGNSSQSERLSFLNPERLPSLGSHSVPVHKNTSITAVVFSVLNNSKLDLESNTQ